MPIGNNDAHRRPRNVDEGPQASDGYVMTIARRACLALALLLPIVPAAASPTWVTIHGQPRFSDVRSQLQALADINGTQDRNEFCVVGQQDGRHRQAYVYWPTENKLILWIPHLYDDQALVRSKRYLDLRRDVVPGNDVHGSTYLLTRTDADAIIHACQATGETFTILKSPVRKASHG